MALVIGDRVLETSTTVGSGSIALGGASPGYQSFSTGVGNGNQTYYAITLDGGSEWEVGIGTYTSVGDTLSRDTVLASSASGAKVSFSAGTKQVFVTYPAEKAVYGDQSGNISAASNKIINLAEPDVATDAATKNYVDNIAAAGITYHAPVQLASTSAFASYNITYNNGTLGVSATITQAVPYSSLTIDSTAAAVNNRILIKNATNAAYNGVYVVNSTGSGATPFVLMRSTDADSYGAGSGDLSLNDYFFTQGGVVNKGVAYVCTTPSAIIFGTTDITFTEFSQSQVYTAGTGIDISGTVISLQTPVATANGGTGLASTPTNGQLLTGNGTGYSLNTLQAGTGISVANAPGSITITNSAPDQTVILTGAGATSVSGTYPSFTISSTNSGGTVTSVDGSSTISGVTLTGGPITTSGRLTLAGTVGTSSGGTGLTSTPTNGQIDIGNGTGFTRTTLTAGSGISITNGAGAITIASTGGSSIPTAETSITISSAYTVTTGKNALSIAPVTIASGGSVTVPNGQTYMVLNSSAGSGGGQVATVGKAIAMTLVFGG